MNYHQRLNGTAVIKFSEEKLILESFQTTLTMCKNIKTLFKGKRTH